MAGGDDMTPREDPSAGKRYEIRCLTTEGTEMVVGWTDRDPEVLRDATTRVPWVRRAWVVDREETT